MPTCYYCGAHTEIVPIGPGDETYQLCTNGECITNTPPDDLDYEPFDPTEECLAWPDEAFPDPVPTGGCPVLPVTTQVQLADILRNGLEVFRWGILSLIAAGDMSQARSLLEIVINVLLHDNTIPPGRSFATKARELGLGMRGMALKKLEVTANDMNELRFLTRAVFNWLVQTEQELKKDLAEQLSHLFPALESQIAVHKNIPEAARLIGKIVIIKKALDNIDRKGSPPIIAR